MDGICISEILIIDLSYQELLITILEKKILKKLIKNLTNIDNKMNMIIKVYINPKQELLAF